MGVKYPHGLGLFLNYKKKDILMMTLDFYKKYDIIFLTSEIVTMVDDGWANNTLLFKIYFTEMENFCFIVQKVYKTIKNQYKNTKKFIWFV